MTKFITSTILLLVVLAIPTPAFAHPGHTNLSQASSPTLTPTEKKASESAQTTTEPEKVNYTLPYPGMLPDHPLYFLKQLRDSIIGVLIADPLKKAEFSLLNADKQVASARALVGKNKNDQAVDSLNQAKSHMSQVVDSLKKASSQDKDTSPLSTKAKTAIDKYQEILKDLKSPLDDSKISSFSTDFTKFQKQLNKLK